MRGRRALTTVGGDARERKPDGADSRRVGAAVPRTWQGRFGERLMEAERRGFLVLARRASRLENAWWERCGRLGVPYARVSKGSRFANVCLDLSPAGGRLGARGEAEVFAAYRRLRDPAGRSVIRVGEDRADARKIPADGAEDLARELLRVAGEHAEAGRDSGVLSRGPSEEVLAEGGVG